MKTYFSIALPATLALYVLASAFSSAGTPTWSWWHPFAGAFLACAALTVGAVIRLITGEDARRLADQVAEKARRDIDWYKMSDAEKDVILELRKRTGTP
jgi:hypothetical protein